MVKVGRAVESAATGRNPEKNCAPVVAGTQGASKLALTTEWFYISQLVDACLVEIVLNRDRSWKYTTGLNWNCTKLPTSAETLLGENVKSPLALPTWITKTWDSAVGTAPSATNQNNFMVAKVFNLEGNIETPASSRSQGQEGGSGNPSRDMRIGYIMKDTPGPPRLKWLPKRVQQPSLSLIRSHATMRASSGVAATAVFLRPAAFEVISALFVAVGKSWWELSNRRETDARAKCGQVSSAFEPGALPNHTALLEEFPSQKCD